MPSAQSLTVSMTRLSSDFIPGPCDVICARGKDAKNHEGNRRYREQVQKSLDTYAKANTRYEKPLIVSEITDDVWSASPDGGFVKKVDGVWHEVGDHLAREKVGQGFRDSLHGLYKSSTKAKRKRREAAGAGIFIDVEQLVQTNEEVVRRLRKLSSDMKLRGEEAPDLFVTKIFTNANLDILEALKKDQSLVSKFHEAEEHQKMCLVPV
jgi:hypothetical protein